MMNGRWWEKEGRQEFSSLSQAVSLSLKRTMVKRIGTASGQCAKAVQFQRAAICFPFIMMQSMAYIAGHASTKEKDAPAQRQRMGERLEMENNGGRFHQAQPQASSTLSLMQLPLQEKV